MNSTQTSGRFAARLAWITILTLSASTLAKPVGAAPTFADMPQVTISYDDLDLTRPAGVVKLYRRIELAAARVCERVNSKAPQNIAATRICAEEAIARAVAQVGSPALSRYYASRAHRIDTPTTAAAQP
jgi:UrcA family protein